MLPGFCSCYSSTTPVGNIGVGDTRSLDSVGRQGPAGQTVSGMASLFSAVVIGLLYSFQNKWVPFFFAASTGGNGSTAGDSFNLPINATLTKSFYMLASTRSLGTQGTLLCLCFDSGVAASTGSEYCRALASRHVPKQMGAILLRGEDTRDRRLARR